MNKNMNPFVGVAPSIAVAYIIYYLLLLFQDLELE